MTKKRVRNLLRGRRQLSTFFFKRTMFVLGGGGVGGCSFERKIGIKFFFWTWLEVEPSSGGTAPAAPMRPARLRHLAAAVIHQFDLESLMLTC